METVHVSARGFKRRRETVASEIALAVVVNGVRVRSLHATPMDLEDLVRGYLLTSGLIRKADDVCELVVELETGVASVRTAGDDPTGWREEAPARPRPSVASLLGSAARDANEPSEHRVVVRREQVIALARDLAEGTESFRSTGSLHRALVLDPATDAAIAMEDVARHNALDKVVGRAMSLGVDLSRCVLARTGRTSAEMMEKTREAGFAVTLSRGAPTSGAVEIAREHGITLIGFAREGAFNIYSRPDRVVP